MITLGILSTTHGTSSADIIDAKLTHGDAGYTTKVNPITSSYISEPGNTTTWNISRFYRDEQTNFNIHGHITLDTNTRIYLGYDHGIDTPKFDVSKAYHIGFAQIIQDNWIVSASTVIGGKERHSPCLDSFDRKYYCETLTAWSDFQEVKHEIPYNASIKYVHRF